MRSDLHVHSIASGMCDTPMLDRICRESYNDPFEVYSRLKHKGMSLVTLTDHDSIDAAETLRKYPDFFLAEEVTVRMPSGCEMHLGVYGISERDHLEIQKRRSDFIRLVMYLSERKLFFSANHLFSGLTGRRDLDDFSWFASYIPAFETRNGQMWRGANMAAARLASTLGKVALAGSDSHTLAGLGEAFTEVPGARTADEFLAGLRAGHGRVQGRHGNYARLTADVLDIVRSMVQEKSWTALLLPLALLVPAFTFGHWSNEIRFSKQWVRLLEDGDKRPRMRWELDATLETSPAA
jgi:predicted metal-dependent phosphoesterase TrpH